MFFNFFNTGKADYCWQYYLVQAFIAPAGNGEIDLKIFYVASLLLCSTAITPLPVIKKQIMAKSTNNDSQNSE